MNESKAIQKTIDSFKLLTEIMTRTDSLFVALPKILFDQFITDVVQRKRYCIYTFHSDCS